MSILALADHRFPVQRTVKDVWVRATAASAAADFLAGYHGVVRRFLAGRAEPELQVLRRGIDEWSVDDLNHYVETTRHQSLVFLVLMLTGACNADCSICFTDRRKKPDELNPASRTRLLLEASALGARYVYIPGEGEPTIDRGFWQMLETCRDTGLEAVVFTNGIVLSDPNSTRRYWGIDPDEAVRRLSRYPVSFYFKLWTTQPKLVAEMMNISAARYNFTPRNGTLVPAGLARLLDGFPRQRVGIEVVVERRNADEVADQIVPFADAEGLARIVELLQHNGRLLGDGSFDPTEEQLRRVTVLLSPTSCSMATCKAVVTSRGFLSPRIAVLEHQIPGQRVHVATGPLFDLLHRTPYLVEHRFEVEQCLCETIPATFSGQRSTVRCRPSNVCSPALTTEAIHFTLGAVEKEEVSCRVTCPSR